MTGSESSECQGGVFVKVAGSRSKKYGLFYEKLFVHCLNDICFQWCFYGECHPTHILLDRRHGFSGYSCSGSLKPDGRTRLLSSMCALFLLQPRLRRIKRFDTWPYFNFKVLCCRYECLAFFLQYLYLF